MMEGVFFRVSSFDALGWLVALIWPDRCKNRLEGALVNQLDLSPLLRRTMHALQTSKFKHPVALWVLYGLVKLTYTFARLF